MEMEKGRSNRRITVCVTQNKQRKKAPILDMGCFLFDLLFPFFPPGDKGKNKVRREGKTQDGGDIKIRQKTEEKINNNNNHDYGNDGDNDNEEDENNANRDGSETDS